MSETNQTKSEITTQENVYFDAEYMRYVLWKSIPSFFIRPPANKDGTRPTALQFSEAIGIDDDEILELMQIKTQGEFAEKYNLNKDTLTGWNKLILKRDALGDIRNFFNRLGKNVLAAMYNNSLSSKNLNADRDRLNFMKIVMGYNDKMEVKHGLEENLADFIKGYMKVTPQKDGDTTQKLPS